MVSWYVLLEVGEKDNVIVDVIVWNYDFMNVLSNIMVVDKHSKKKKNLRNCVNLYELYEYVNFSKCVW